MDIAKNTAGLAMQVGFILGHFWFISLPLAMVAAVAFGWLHRHRPVTDGARLALWLCLLFPLGMLVFGGLLPGFLHSNITAASWIVNGALALLVVAYVYAIFRARRQRLPTSAVAVTGMWLSLCVSFITSMAITGNWL